MEDPKSGDIPLIISEDGVALRLLKDYSDWMDKQKKARKIRRAGGVLSESESNHDDAPRKQSTVRKLAKPSHTHSKKHRYEEVTDESDRDDRHERRKSTHQQSPLSGKRARDTSVDGVDRRAGQKGKDRRQDDWSSDDDDNDNDRRRRKKSKIAHTGNRRRERDTDGANASHRFAKSSKPARDISSGSSVSSDSDSD